MTDRDDTTTVDKIMSRRDQEEQNQEIKLERQREFVKALNGVASTPNGQLFLKTLIKACKALEPKSAKDTLALIEVNAKANVYLEFIRPYLETELRQELEN